MASDCEENNIEMPQFRLFWPPYALLTEDNVMDKDLQDTLTKLDRPNDQDLTENHSPTNLATNQFQEESNTENLEKIHLLIHILTPNIWT